MFLLMIRSFWFYEKRGSREVWWGRSRELGTFSWRWGEVNKKILKGKENKTCFHLPSSTCNESHDQCIAFYLFSFLSPNFGTWMNNIYLL